MSYETNRCDRIVCDYPDCDATTRLWRENEDSAYSDADDLKWLTIEVELDGDEYVERHFCPRHLDTTRPEWASGYIYPTFSSGMVGTFWGSAPCSHRRANALP